MVFRDHAHQAFYEQAVAAEQAEDDPSRKALFYTLGLCEEARQHINDLYNFNRHVFKENGLDRQWQTEQSRGVCRLAFNLFNGFHGRNIWKSEAYTPWRLFCSDLLPYLLEAVRVRFGEEDG